MTDNNMKVTCRCGASIDGNANFNAMFIDFSRQHNRCVEAYVRSADSAVDVPLVTIRTYKDLPKDTSS